jgi:hypothetical protein
MEKVYGKIQREITQVQKQKNVYNCYASTLNLPAGPERNFKHPLPKAIGISSNF